MIEMRGERDDETKTVACFHEKISDREPSGIESAKIDSEYKKRMYFRKRREEKKSPSAGLLIASNIPQIMFVGYKQTRVSVKNVQEASAIPQTPITMLSRKRVSRRYRSIKKPTNKECSDDSETKKE